MSLELIVLPLHYQPILAVPVGFEPTEHFIVLRFSKPLHYHSAKAPYSQKWDGISHISFKTYKPLLVITFYIADTLSLQESLAQIHY